MLRQMAPRGHVALETALVADLKAATIVLGRNASVPDVGEETFHTRHEIGKVAFLPTWAQCARLKRHGRYIEKIPTWAVLSNCTGST